MVIFAYAGRAAMGLNNLLLKPCFLPSCPFCGLALVFVIVYLFLLVKSCFVPVASASW